MAILKPKRGSGLPSGLQQHELAIDVLNRRIYLGNTGGTGDIVSSHITDYVSTLNSATGAVNLYAGSGLSVATSTSIKGITFTNTGVLSIDSATGAITNVARTNVAQTFTALQSFTTGISSSGNILLQKSTNAQSLMQVYAGATGSLSSAVITVGSNPGYATSLKALAESYTTNSTYPSEVANAGVLYCDGAAGLRIHSYNANMQFWTGNTGTLKATLTTGGDFFVHSGNINVGLGVIAQGGTFSALTRFNGGISASGGTFSGTFNLNGSSILTSSTAVTSVDGVTGAVDLLAGSGVSITLPSGASKGITLANTGVLSLNGSTGTVTAVASLNSATGAVNLFAGTGLSVASSTSIRGITFTNTGVLSIDSATGAITNVARTNVAQTFTALQSFSSGISAAGGTFTALARFNSGITCTGITLSGNLNISGANRYVYHDGLIIEGRGGGVNSPSSINIPSVSGNLTLNSGSGTVSIVDATASAITPIAKISLKTTGTDGLSNFDSQFTLQPIGAPASTNTYTLSMPTDSGTIALTKGVVSSFNGLTGSVTGVTTGNANTFVALQTFNSGISAAAGVTFSTPIVSTRLSRTSSAVFDTKTADFSPTEADNGKIFVINISGKTLLTVTLDGLSVGWRAKFLVLGGSGVSFTSTGGTVLGSFGSGGLANSALSECVEVHCYATNAYHAS